ncbi:VOC family protein [Paenibacillus radicis (ex Xue et al. 2023)]|uniref:VOC family protein n=1 Tax=Paenibacillus radicis (ex Xue et al. 2023) TaxID=2972489 RepID=A0ABT1YIN4_9BACL|nr:VOC family protein [Paenibacillus radicis (ex Xue et al. 2023)]MCR8633041.1 VOC family protein [Paenibacillus radicis (ex Xue et al. 2023)]
MDAIKSVGSKTIVKLGIVVDNVEEAASYYAKIFGMEMPEVSTPGPEAPPDPSGKAYTWYQGSDRKPRCKVAKIYTEPVYLELIEPLPDVPNPFTDFKEKHGQGVYFISFYIDGFEQHVQFMEELGMPLTFKQDKGHERYAYFDSIAQLALTLEFKEVGSR